MLPTLTDGTVAHGGARCDLALKLPGASPWASVFHVISTFLRISLRLHVRQQEYIMDLFPTALMPLLWCLSFITLIRCHSLPSRCESGICVATRWALLSLPRSSALLSLQEINHILSLLRMLSIPLLPTILVSMQPSTISVSQPPPCAVKNSSHVLHSAERRAPVSSDPSCHGTWRRGPYLQFVPASHESWFH